MNGRSRFYPGVSLLPAAPVREAVLRSERGLPRSRRASRTSFAGTLGYSLLNPKLSLAIILAKSPRDGGATADTTFKEFVEEEGLTFAPLDVDSRNYRDLVQRFNNAKFRLRAAAEGRLRESARSTR